MEKEKKGKKALESVRLVGDDLFISCEANVNDFPPFI